MIKKLVPINNTKFLENFEQLTKIGTNIRVLCKSSNIFVNKIFQWIVQGLIKFLQKT